MDIRKTVKKIAALAAGATMLGATIMGAVALDLSDYPAPFVADGVFDGKIVVGKNAATSDVVGAIDLAASLQAEATSTTAIDIPGTAGTATVTGDSAEFKTGSDILSMGETIGDVKQTFTSNDLDGLKEGVFDTGLGSTPVKQYLKFDNTTAYVDYAENDDDEVGDFLYFPSDDFMFEYHLEFTEGAVSEIGASNQLDDLESEILTVLGAPFTIVEAKRGSGDSIEITMLGGEVADVLRDGETKTYTIDGVDYEVTAIFIDSGSSQSAKLSVNGVMTKELTEGKTQVLGGDVTIGVQEILTNQREGLVEFYLGANKIKFDDSDYTSGNYTVESVKVGTHSVNNAYLDIKATNNTANDEVKVNYIKFKVPAADDVYVPAGEGLKSFLEDSEDMLTDTWDILYAGLMDTGVSIIKVNAKSDHSYEFEFENVNGDMFDFPLITNEDGIYKWGDDDDHFVFTENNDGNQSAGNLTADKNTFISDDDYFLLSDRTTSVTEDKAVSSVLRYQSISTGDSTITFRDLSGDNVVVSYTGTLGTDANGELIVAGKSHDFYIGATNADDEEKYALSMDLDGDSTFGTTMLYLVARGGGIVDFGAQTFTATGPAGLTTPQTMNITTPASQFDESSEGPVAVTFNLTNATSNEMDMNMVSPSLFDDPVDEDWEREINAYGTLIERFSPSSGSAIPELTVNYPLVQRGVQVFVGMGTVEVQEGTAGGGGSVDTTDVNPIAVGLAVLDENAPAIGTENIIVVGGPCANSVAAELMGNPENCGEGFEPGKAVIKLWADQNALLVAGYEAQETLGASYVLADYEDYDLSGTEVEVVVADLSTITVNPVV